MIRQFLPFTKGLLELKIRLDSHVRWYLTIGIDWQKLSCGIHSTESVGRICEQEQPYFGPRTWAAQVSNGKPKRQRPIPGFWIPIDHVRSSRHYCWQQLCDEAGTWLDSKDAEIFVQVVVDVFKRKLRPWNRTYLKLWKKPMDNCRSIISKITIAILAWSKIDFWNLPYSPIILKFK